MKTISIPTNDRPDYFQRVVDSILAAEGAKEWTLAIASEPCVEIRQMVRRMALNMGLDRVEIRENPKKQGCRKNTFLAVQFAKDLGSDFNLYLEEDTVISPDALTLCDQWLEKHLPGVLCLRRWHTAQDLNRPNEVVIQNNQGLLGDGFAFGMDLFPFLEKWWFLDDPKAGGKMWDWSVDYGLNLENIPQWRPLVNRSRNIGVSGTHTSTDQDLNRFGPNAIERTAKFEFL